MRFASLCSGIGGADLALEAHGHHAAWHAELDPAPASVHALHWPDLPNVGDITDIDWAACEPVDIITAGFPCQPFSAAGKRKGTNDDRHLWPHVRDAVVALRPRYLYVENVVGIYTLGAAIVVHDLAQIGYMSAWGSLGSSAVGGCHRRERFWLLATDANSASCETLERRQGSGDAGRFQLVERDRAVGVDLLPTPRTSDANGAGAHGDGGPDLRTVASTLHMDDGVLLTDASPTEVGSSQVLRDVRSHDAPKAVRRSARGQDSVSESEELFAGLREHQVGPHEGRLSSAGRGAQAGSMRGLRFDGPIDPASPRSRLEEQRSSEPHHPLPPLPHDPTLAGRLGWRDAISAWGKYAPAVERWALIFGFPPPSPTIDGRLNPRAVEWMMGFPTGWVTGAGLSRSAELRALGNAQQPQVATAALSILGRRIDAMTDQEVLA